MCTDTEGCAVTWHFRVIINMMNYCNFFLFILFIFIKYIKLISSAPDAYVLLCATSNHGQSAIMTCSTRGQQISVP